MATQFPNDLEPVTVQKKPARALGGWVILVVAILAGLGAAYLAVSTLKSRELAALQRINQSQQKNLLRAVVPVRDVPAGTILDLSMVAARSIPAETAPADVITPEDFERFAGHRVNVPLQEGRPILASYLSGRRTLADLVDPNKLAMTFSVDNISTLDGMLQPGDHVDVLWFYAGGGDENRGGRGGRGGRGALPVDFPMGQNPLESLSGGENGLSYAGPRPGAGGPVIFRAGPSGQEANLPKDTVRYLEHDLKIIATGTRTVADDSAANINNDPAQSGQPAQFNTVTVELSPEQIQKLTLAKRMGELQLVLRSHNSQVVAPAKVYTVRDILGIRERAGGPLYAADTIEYIIGSTGNNGQLNTRVDIRNLRRVAEGMAGGPGGRAGRYAQPPQSPGVPQQAVPINQILPPINAGNPSYPFPTQP